MQLTQEHFDEGLSNLLDKVATKDDLTKLEAKIDTKFDAQTKELKQYTNDAFETQQEWMDERFKELIIKYDVRDRVEKLEKEVAQLKLHRPAHA